MGWIEVEGRVTPGFSFAILGSFQVLMVPMYMSATTGPVSRSGFDMPGRLYETVVAASAHGIITQPLQPAFWLAVSGASLAPKSTVREEICWIPPPLPMAPYVIVTPFAV